MISFENKHITVFQSSLVQTNSTILQTDDMVLVVDPAWLPEEVDYLKNQVERMQNGRPIYLLFTHSDFDHILGYGAFTDVKTIASKEVSEHPEKEEILKKIKTFD